jgi:hypothetical protein
MCSSLASSSLLLPSAFGTSAWLTPPERIFHLNDRYIWDMLRSVLLRNGRTFWAQTLRQVVNVLKNPVLTAASVSIFMKHYSRCRRIERAFVRLLHRWRLHKYPIAVQTDLYMTPLLSPQEDAHVVILFQNERQYYFSLHDLAHTMLEAITHHDGLFSAPLAIKNPYTNVPFTKTDLFHMFLTARRVGFPMPSLLSQFFRCECNVFLFRRKFEPVLRTEAIAKFISTASVNELYPDVLDMLYRHNMSTRIAPDVRFPKSKFVDRMRPFLRLFFVEMYSLDTNERTHAHYRLRSQLLEFSRKHPDFGKRMPRIVFTAPLVFYEANHHTMGPAFSLHDYFQDHVYNEIAYRRHMYAEVEEAPPVVEIVAAEGPLIDDDLTVESETERPEQDEPDEPYEPYEQDEQDEQDDEQSIS